MTRPRLKTNTSRREPGTSSWNGARLVGRVLSRSVDAMPDSDYYETLGIAARRHARGCQEGLPRDGPEMASRRQPRRQVQREEVQGSSASLRHPLGSREARLVRPVWHRRLRGHGRGRPPHQRLGVDGTVRRARSRDHRFQRVLRTIQPAARGRAEAAATLMARESSTTCWGG